MIPDAELDRLESLAQAATPGEWVASVGSGPKRRVQHQFADVKVSDGQEELFG